MDVELQVSIVVGLTASSAINSVRTPIPQLGTQIIIEGLLNQSLPTSIHKLLPINLRGPRSDWKQANTHQTKEKRPNKTVSVTRDFVQIPRMCTRLGQALKATKTLTELPKQTQLLCLF